jgi:hypothetical protein
MPLAETGRGRKEEDEDGAERASAKKKECDDRRRCFASVARARRMVSVRSD